MTPLLGFKIDQVNVSVFSSLTLLYPVSERGIEVFKVLRRYSHPVNLKHILGTESLIISNFALWNSIKLILVFKGFLPTQNSSLKGGPALLDVTVKTRPHLNLSWVPHAEVLKVEKRNIFFLVPSYFAWHRRLFFPPFFFSNLKPHQKKFSCKPSLHFSLPPSQCNIAVILYLTNFKDLAVFWINKNNGGSREKLMRVPIFCKSENLPFNSQWHCSNVKDVCTQKDSILKTSFTIVLVLIFQQLIIRKIWVCPKTSPNKLRGTYHCPYKLNRDTTALKISLSINNYYRKLVNLRFLFVLFQMSS